MNKIVMLPLEIRRAIISAGAEKTEREIARELGIARSTVHYWRVVGVPCKKVTGRPRKTSIETDAKIVSMSQSEPFVPATEWRRRLQLCGVTAQTIRNRLHAGGLKSRVPARKMGLKPEHLQKRLEFVMQHLHWSVSEWSRVLFSDEKLFSSSGHGPLRVWRPIEGDRFDEKYVSMTPNTRKFSIPVWMGFCTATRQYSLHYIRDKTLKSPYYIQHILEPYVVGNGWFMHDRSPIHTSKVVTTFLESHRIQWLQDWPPKGADLNPVENVWAELERRLANRRSDEEGSHAERVENLWVMIRDAFNAIPESYFETLVASMPDRLASVATRFGGWSHY